MFDYFIFFFNDTATTRIYTTDTLFPYTTLFRSLGSNLPHMWKCDAIYFEQQPGLQTEAVVIHFREDFWGSAFLELPEMNGVRKLLDRAKRGINIYGNTKQQIRHKMEVMLRAEGAERVELLLNILQRSEEHTSELQSL